MNKMLYDIKNYCYTDIKTRKYEYTWSIVDFCNICQCNIDITSSNLCNAFCTFTINFRPEDNKFYFRISEMNSEETFMATFHVWLITTEGKKISKVEKMTRLVNNMLIHAYTLSTILENPTDYLFNKTLTIGVEFNIFQDFVNNTIYMDASLPYRMFIENQNIVSADQKSDVSNVTFIIENKYLIANKALLCLKSEIFNTLIQLKANEKDEIIITNTTYDILSQLLLFVQTGVQPKLEDMSIKTLYELCVAADRYAIIDLKKCCETRLINNISLHNAIELLQLTNVCKIENLKQCVTDFCRLYINELLRIPQFKNLIRDNPEYLNQILVKHVTYKQTEIKKCFD